MQACSEELGKRIEELEAKLKDRHKRMDKLHKRNADLLDAWEDMDLTKDLKSRIEELEAELKQERRKSDFLLLAANTWQDKCEALEGKQVRTRLDGIINYFDELEASGGSDE